ncbi:uncharacterized protein LOC119336301 [Triticum dicoccoides]|nr:uncharacterized protein LOC119336301 [Triticum dicoccoides]
MPLLLWLFLLGLSIWLTPVLALPPNPQRSCKFQVTTLAAVSCSESPISPTASCCEALIYAIDSSPDSELDRGICCLCEYILAQTLPFDLAYTYRACRGKDASEVEAFFSSPPVPFTCKVPCYHDDNKPSPPAKEANKGTKLSSPAIAGIVIGGLVLIGFVGAWVYYKFFSPSAKARGSPNPSDDSSRGIELPPQSARFSSARNSTSNLLET